MKKKISKEAVCGQVQDEQRRHSQSKGAVKSFVMKKAHARKRSQRSAQSGKEKQAFFGDAAFALPRTALIRAHKGKSPEIPYGRPGKEQP